MSLTNNIKQAMLAGNVVGINLLAWHTNYDSLTWQPAGRVDEPRGFIFTNCTEEQFEEKHAEISKHLKEAGKLDKPYVKAYIYLKTEEE